MNFSILLIYTLTSTTEPFNAAKAFLALSVVNVLRFPLTLIPFVITGVIQVSIIKRHLIMMSLFLFCLVGNLLVGIILKEETLTITPGLAHAIYSVFILSVSANRCRTFDHR